MTESDFVEIIAQTRLAEFMDNRKCCLGPWEVTVWEQESSADSARKFDTFDLGSCPSSGTINWLTTQELDESTILTTWRITLSWSHKHIRPE